MVDHKLESKSYSTLVLQNCNAIQPLTDKLLAVCANVVQKLRQCKQRSCGLFQALCTSLAGEPATCGMEQLA